MFKCILQINQKLYFIGVGAVCLYNLRRCWCVYVKSQYHQLRWCFQWYLNMNVKLKKLRASTTCLRWTLLEISCSLVRRLFFLLFFSTKTDIHFPSWYNSCVCFIFFPLFSTFDGTNAIILIWNYTHFQRRRLENLYFLNSIPERWLVFVTLIAFGFDLIRMCP